MMAGGILSSLVGRYLEARRTVGLGERILWWFMPIAAVVTVTIVLIGGLPILAALISGEPSPRGLDMNAAVPGYLVIHVIMGVLAILIGLGQLLSSVREAYPVVHRWLGRIYVGLVVPSSAACLFLTPRVETGGVRFVLFSMGALWLTATVLGVLSIRRGNITAHRAWMLRSYALTWAGGVLFRVLMVITKLFGMPIDARYPVSVWLAVAICILFAEAQIRRSGHPSFHPYAFR